MVSRIIDKYLSRKFFVFVISTLFLYFKVIDEKTWLLVAMIYMGVEGVLDLVKFFLKK